MDSEIEDILMLTGAYFAIKRMKLLRKRRKWPAMRVNPYLWERKIKGRLTKDLQDLKLHTSQFVENFRMDVETFEVLFTLIEPHLVPRCNSRPEDCIGPKEKFCAVLEYLASGSLQRHVASVYRISKQHFGRIINQVCDAIFAKLQGMIPKMDKNQFLNNYNSRWQFKNCIGAIDGKHVAIKAPASSGSLFYNYKGFHSLLLLATCDASYKFTYLDIGAYGSEGDASVFASSKFGHDVMNDSLDFPENATVIDAQVPFYFVGDDAFPLCKCLIKPYSKRGLSKEESIFNYRLSRARRCIENAFGILCWKWLCLKRTMLCGPERAKKIITACCLLHNFMLSKTKTNYCPQRYVDHIDENGVLVEGEWRRQLSLVNESMFGNSMPTCRGRHADIGKSIREKSIIKKFVNSPEGSVTWQDRAAFVV